MLLHLETGFWSLNFFFSFPAFKKQFSLTVSIKWLSTMKSSPEESFPPQNPSKGPLKSTLKPPRHILNFPQPTVLPPRMARPPASPSFCKAVGGPVAPQGPRSSSSTYSQSTASPVMLLHEMCEAAGFGQPLYEMYCSHAGPNGFLYFTYKVCISGVDVAFEGVVLILPGPTATTTLEEARRAAAQQVLHRVYLKQPAH